MAGDASIQIDVVPDQAPYLSCWHLERGLVFFPGRLTACCANPITGMQPELAKFSGGTVDIDAIAETRRQIIEEHKAGRIIKDCQHCPKLIEVVPDDPRLGSYPIADVTIAHFTSCNIRCNYCYTVIDGSVKANISKVPPILPTFQELVERKQLNPGSRIRFSGGEPTLLPEFDALVKLLSDYGCQSIIHTNATRLSPSIIEGLARDTVELVLGMDAATDETYRAIKKMNYNEKVWANAGAYVAARRPEAKNKIWFKFIFCMENYTEAVQFVERAASVGATHVYYDFDESRPAKLAFDETGGAILRNGNGRDEPLPEEVADWCAALRYECFKRGIDAQFCYIGYAWLTPERTARMEAELARLKTEEDASASAA